MDRAKLKGKIAEKGFNLTTLAKAIGMPYTMLYHRVNDNDLLTIAETRKICKVLELSNQEKIEIFLI